MATHFFMRRLFSPEKKMWYTDSSRIRRNNKEYSERNSHFHIYLVTLKGHDLDDLEKIGWVVIHWPINNE
jgi:hypothetical protein